MQKVGNNVTGQSIHFGDFFNFVTPKLHADCMVGVACGEDVDTIAPNTEGATMEVHIVADVLDGNEFFDYVPWGHLVAWAQGQTHFVVLAGRTQTIDTRYTCNNDGISALEK